MQTLNSGLAHFIKPISCFQNLSDYTMHIYYRGNINFLNLNQHDSLGFNSLTEMKRGLHIQLVCFATSHSLVFNASKTQLIHFSPHSSTTCFFFFSIICLCFDVHRIHISVINTNDSNMYP